MAVYAKIKIYRQIDRTMDIRTNRYSCGCTAQAPVLILCAGALQLMLIRQPVSSLIFGCSWSLRVRWCRLLHPGKFRIHLQAHRGHVHRSNDCRPPFFNRLSLIVSLSRNTTHVIQTYPAHRPSLAMVCWLVRLGHSLPRAPSCIARHHERRSVHASGGGVPRSLLERAHGAGTRDCWCAGSPRSDGFCRVFEPCHVAKTPVCLPWCARACLHASVCLVTDRSRFVRPMGRLAGHSETKTQELFLCPRGVAGPRFNLFWGGRAFLVLLVSRFQHPLDIR